MLFVRNWKIIIRKERDIYVIRGCFRVNLIRNEIFIYIVKICIVNIL